MTNGLIIVNSRADATPKLPAILPGSIPRTVHFSLFEESNNFKFIQTLQNKSNTNIYSTDKYYIRLFMKYILIENLFRKKKIYAIFC